MQMTLETRNGCNGTIEHRWTARDGDVIARTPWLAPGFATSEGAARLEANEAMRAAQRRGKGGPVGSCWHVTYFA